MAFEKTWRWFGQKDSVALADLKQMGIEGVVTALHHIPNGEVWTVDEIMKVKTDIESYGMRWSVVESLPVSEGIKTHSSDYPRLIANYKQSIRNLGQCGIDTVCYNFMPVLDWVRTDLHYKLPEGGEVMYFDFPMFVAFDAFILNRPGAENDYPVEIVNKARLLRDKMTDEDAEKLAYNTIIVTQGFINGAVDGSTPDYKKAFLNFIDTYKNIDRDHLRANLVSFLKDVIPVAEASGVNMCIHPDDPPFPVLGLPRIVSTLQDLECITFCTGSLSVNRTNDLVGIVKSVGHRIHFLHLRNNVLLPDGCFHEFGHIHGVVDMYAVMTALLQEQNRRKKEGRSDTRMPVRPDHGIKMLDDYGKKANPGYPLIGRLKGLSELSGLEMGIERFLNQQ
jgi:mannonate dehydratase